MDADKLQILKVRVGNGNSAVDVEWDDKELRWTIQSRAFDRYWFSLSAQGKEGYEKALELADEFEVLLQRMHRHFEEAKNDELTIKEFIDFHQREIDKPSPS